MSELIQNSSKAFSETGVLLVILVRNRGWILTNAAGVLSAAKNFPQFQVHTFVSGANYRSSTIEDLSTHQNKAKCALFTPPP